MANWQLMVRSNNGIYYPLAGEPFKLGVNPEMKDEFDQLAKEILRLEFPKDEFTPYHQEAIERNLDKRPILLPDLYEPTSYGEFQIIDYSDPTKIFFKERKSRKK